MITIASTRFNNETWSENVEYRRFNQINGCIYGSPNPMSESILLNSNVIICEMNNSSNQIMGFGLIKNYLYVNQYYKIYSKGNYNRYTYKSEYRVDRNELNETELKYLHDIENIVFKGKGHLKRGFGITSIPTKKINELKYNIKNELIKIFSTRFHVFD